MDRSAAHIVPVPGYVTIIRAVQVVLSIIVLGLTANTLNYLNKTIGSYSSVAVAYVSEPLGFMVFCCVWTWLVCAYLIVTPLLFPIAYNMWAHLALEVVSWIFWLAGFASTASWAADYAHGKRALGSAYNYWATSAAAAGFGALIWVTFFVTLVVFCLRLNAFRNDPANAHASGLGFAEKGQGESHQMGVVPPQHVPAPQQTQTPVYQDQGPTPVQYSSAPTPVQYTNTPPPQQWQQSPPPPGQQY